MKFHILYTVYIYNTFLYSAANYVPNGRDTCSPNETVAFLTALLGKRTLRSVQSFVCTVLEVCAGIRYDDLASADLCPQFARRPLQVIPPPELHRLRWDGPVREGGEKHHERNVPG